MSKKYLILSSKNMLIQPKNMTSDILAKGFRELGVKLYSEEFTKWRRDTFKTKLKKRAYKTREGKDG